MPTYNIKNIVFKKKEILTSGTEKYCYNIVTQGTIKTNQKTGELFTLKNNEEL